VKRGELQQSASPEWVGDSVLVQRTYVAGIWMVSVTSGDGRLVVVQGGQPRFDAKTGWIYYVVANPDFTSEIWRVRRDGTGATSLVRPTEPGVRLSSPSPSPDGRSVAFAQTSEVAREGELRVLDLTTGDTRTIATSSGGGISGYFGISSVRWSPSGEWIAWIDEFKIGLYGAATVRWSRPDGSDPRQMASSPGERGLAWSPDGRYLAMSVIGNDRYPYGPIYVLDISTGDLVRTNATGASMSWK
jgi:Tol biopolymer transport system component